MEVHFFERKSNSSQVSIEKLFSVIKGELEKKGITSKVIQNPFPLSQMLKSLWFFSKNQGNINHITGDIHWASLVLDSERTVLTIHDLVGLHQLKGLKRKLYFSLWVYLPLKKLKYVTVISEKTKKEITNLLPWAEKKIQVIPNCLTIPIPENFEKVKNAIPKLLIVGTRSNKNADNSIKALKNIICELHIVGDITNEQKEHLENHKINYTVHSDIDESSLIQLYKESDLLLFPSLYEGFGLPILEAQACQCAVITSNISPMKEVAGNGAVLVDPASVLEISEAVKRIISDNALKNKLIKEGLENIKKYMPDQIAQQYFDLYQKIKNRQSL